MPQVEITTYTFIVKEGQASASGVDDAPLSIALEAETPDLNVLAGGSLQILLSTGTTLEQAQDLARLLRRHAKAVKYQSR